MKPQWYGNNYGGFYVIPELINSNSVVYSFGIGYDISFDMDMINKHDCKVYAFDPTPLSIKWIKKQNINKNFVFFDYGIGIKNECVNFYLPKNKTHISGSIVNQNNVDENSSVNVEVKSLKTIMQTLKHNCIDVLKMDIEGSEYSIIDYIISENIKPNQLLIEFHGRFLINGENKTKNAIKKLQEYGYNIFAVSKSGEEISFLKKE